MGAAGPATGHHSPDHCVTTRFPTALVYEPPPGLPHLVFVDEHLAVACKPSGLLSVPGRLPEHHDSAFLRLQDALGPLWVVHRLDMDTSGLIAFARTREAAAHLCRQFERRTVAKRYEARVWGHPPSDAGVIDLPLRLDWPHRPRQVVDARQGKPSLTRYVCVERQAHTSRLLLTPVTGRSHQLRVHLSAIGLPIQGDRFYGLEAAEGARGANPSCEAVDRLMLHARELTLQHPADERPLSWSLPAEF